MNSEIQRPTFWLLDGSLGWRTGQSRGISESARSLRLAADPEGPLSLSWPDESLGGITLPRGMAFDEEKTLYLFEVGSPWRVKRFTPERQTFLPLPGVGSDGWEARQFHKPRNIAIAGHNLYVADSGNYRIQVFDVESLALHHVWEPSPSLVPGDLVDPGSLVVKLRDGQDPLAQYIREQLSPNTWKLLDEYHHPETPTEVLIRALTRELNRLLQRSALYGEARFDTLSDATQDFIQRGPQGKWLAVLNRLLLEEAYPGEIARRLWQAYDVAAQAGVAYILDRRCGRVYRHQPGRRSLTLLVREPDAIERWSRIAVDREGRIYLLDRSEANQPKLWIYDASGQKIDEVTEAGDVRDRFDPPPLRLLHDQRQADDPAKGYFCLPGSLGRLCDRRPAAPPPTPEVPLGLCPPWSGEPANGGLIFDRRGQPVRLDPAELIENRLYRMEGTWISQPLDSKHYHCQWHRISLALADLPPGTQLVVSTYAADDETPQPPAESPAWQVCYQVAGQTQPPPGGSDLPISGAQADRLVDFLVQSRQGQYLWLKIEFHGGGYGSPVVRSLRVHYPRESYLNYLPRVYSDDNSRWFLERFLSIFQTEWDDLEEQIERVVALFDPGAVPADHRGFLENLARWVALPLEDTWTSEQKRNLLKAVPEIYPQRGTPAGLRAYLQAYLHSLTNQPPDKQGDYPQLVEGFRERQRLMLSSSELAGLGHSGPLWGPASVGRLQLDDFAQAGEVRLVSTGDPERDLFHEYAHRFRVFIPAAWVRSAEDERMLRRALDTEKPGHTHYDLCLVEPRFRVGIQSTIGLDTILGDYPVARLSCPQELQNAPPSRPPRHRLGYDTVLGGQSEKPPSLPMRLDTILD